MKRKDIGLMMVGLVGLLLCGGLIMAVRESASHPEIPAVVPVEPKRPTKDTSTDEPLAATPTSYKLVVGANPTVNQKQTFSPPTNSVAVTNQAQLDLLTKQAKELRQQAKK